MSAAWSVPRCPKYAGTCNDANTYICCEEGSHLKCPGPNAHDDCPIDPNTGALDCPKGHDAVAKCEWDPSHRGAGRPQMRTCIYDDSFSPPEVGSPCPCDIFNEDRQCS